MVNEFYSGQMQIERLNYVVITLLPKIKDANNIKQYKPICLINVSFMTFSIPLFDQEFDVAHRQDY